MDNNNKSAFPWMGHAKVVTLVAIVLSVFLAAKAIRELKEIPYVGRDASAANTITVSGKGEVYAQPDIATFNFTVREEALTVKTAQDRVNKKASDIIAFLEKAGVAKKDIKNIGYNIYPRYEYERTQVIYPPYPPEGKRVLAGYEVSQTIEIKIRKIEEAGNLVSGVGSLGVSDLGGLNFSVEDDTELLSDAREKAIDDAEEKAHELAGDLGVRLVRIVSFSENGNYPMYYGKLMAGDARGNAVPEAAAQLPPGENQFISNVSITYEIR